MSDNQLADRDSGPECRWSERQFTDGFNSVQDKTILISKKSRIRLSDDDCLRLANLPELYVDQWTKLVGVGDGQSESYVISDTGVRFRKWDRADIAVRPVEWQSEMHRDNRIAPELRFPCSPEDVIKFIDEAIGPHGFCLPDAFRLAVGSNMKQRHWQDLAKLEELNLEDWEELTGIFKCKDGLFVCSQSGIIPVQYSDEDLRLLTKQERQVLLEVSRIRPLVFPCSPTELIRFVDQSLDFNVPDCFRAAVETKIGAETTAIEPAPNDAPQISKPDFDISAERGCRRMILDNWATIVSLHGSNADGRQVLRVIERNKDKDQSVPKLKTVQNKLCELRNENLIP